MDLFVQILILLFIQIVLLDAINYDPNCNFEQKAEFNQTYYVYNLEYPNTYGPSQKCHWTLESPPNTLLQLNCDVDIPSKSSQECGDDVMIVSQTGSDDLSDGHKYCGKGNFSITSQSNKMSIGFFSASNTNGGRFLCSLGVVELSPPCDCGWRNTRRIFGGVDTGVNEYPMMTALVNFSSMNIFCGGVIISKNYIMTAAQCLVKADLGNTGVLVGDWDISTGTDTNKSKIYNSAQFLIHNDFSSKTYTNDIALIKTTKPIAFSLEVGPVCLPILYQETNFQGTYVTELGWGALGFNYPLSSILQKVDLRVISLEVCKETYPSIQNRQFCTNADDRGSCQGDSGGPALWQRNGTSRLQLLGIISFGNGCGMHNDSLPGVNIKVAAYIDWIRDNTLGESFCALE